MNCTISTLKFVVIIGNVLAAILGITTIVICSVTLTNLHEELLSFCIFGIVVGLIVCTIAFFGCCGAHRESPSYMWRYAALLSIMLVVQLVIFSIYHSKDFVDMATDEVEQLWVKELKNPGPMAQLEMNFDCCGLHGPKDYLVNNRTIPSSCYQEEKPEESNLYAEGCWEALAHIYLYLGNFIRFTNWILCGIEAISLIFACILARSFNSYNRMSYANNKNLLNSY